MAPDLPVNRQSNHRFAGFVLLSEANRPVDHPGVVSVVQTSGGKLAGRRIQPRLGNGWEETGLEIFLGLKLKERGEQAVYGILEAKPKRVKVNIDS